MTCDPGCTCRGTIEPGDPGYDEAVLRALDLISAHTQREAEVARSKQCHPARGVTGFAPGYGGGIVALPGGGGE